MKKALAILKQTRRIWQSFKYAEACCYGLGIGLFVLHFTGLEIALVTAFVAATVTIIWLKPWTISLQKVASLYDVRYSEVENSTHLLLKKASDLSLLGKIQRQKVAKLFRNHKPTLPPHRLSFAAFFLMGMMLVGYLISSVLPANKGQEFALETKKEQPIDSMEIVDSEGSIKPRIKNAWVSIIPPAYTALKSRRTKEMNIEAVEGTRLQWTLKGNEEVTDILLETSGKSTKELNKAGDSFSISAIVKENGFYNFKLKATTGDELITDLYRITMIPDHPPTIEITGLRQYNSYDYNEAKKADIQAFVQDDFGLHDVYIIATVAKGSGESVKFREEKLLFDQNIIGKEVSLRKSIDLDKMNMGPGDELYFYLEAVDNKYPDRQKTRTETYFLSIRDTTDIEFSLAGSLGVDLMPEYFRSQRQIIIDTEKLIENKQSLAQPDFNFKSNELGFDQKALRLKYGQFMGVEDESGIAIETEEVMEEVESDNDDPLAEYSHDHDGDNEHNLVHEDDHAHEDGEDNPLEKFMHNHDDPEEATLYTQSTRSMLKEAMAQMWDAELYLRLYEPEKSLPYQYKALDLIKKIKNQARIYVHRIGFDPPPLKEDKRLTGDLDEVNTTNYTVEAAEADRLLPIRKTIKVIENLINESRSVQPDEYLLFEDAGAALAPLAIEQPVKYLKSLEKLKKLANQEVEQVDLKATLAYLYRNLGQSIPKANDEITARDQPMDALTKSFLNQLNQEQNE